MENQYLAMLWSAFAQALPYLVFLAAFVIALKWLEAKFMPKRRGRKWRGNRRSWRQQSDRVVEVVAGDHTPAERRRIVEKLVQKASEQV